MRNSGEIPSFVLFPKKFNKFIHLSLNLKMLYIKTRCTVYKVKINS